MRRTWPPPDPAGLFSPFQKPRARDVAPQQVAAVAEPDRPFGKAAIPGDALDRSVAKHVFLKARIEHLDVRIGVADRRCLILPARVCHPGFPLLRLESRPVRG